MGQGLLPVSWFFYDPNTGQAEIERETKKQERSWGPEARSAG